MAARQPSDDRLLTDTAGAELRSVSALLERMHDVRPRDLHVQRRAFRGGLESAGVARLVAHYLDHRDRRRVFTLVVKHLRGATTREALIYEHLVAGVTANLAPGLLATHRPGPGGAVLYLEAVRRTSAWPWKDLRNAQAVLDRVARLHADARSQEAVATLGAWDYEADLQQTAMLTITRLELLPSSADFTHLRRGTRLVRRVVAALPLMRRQLLTFAPLTRTAIHGDLHSGNAVMRRRGGREEPVLLDWGRARLGSPLEDVSSWLHSLGCWEPEARRRHDTLFSAYLSARGLDRILHSDLRGAYWLAGASNALAGALLHHLSVATDHTVSDARRASAVSSALEWLRVLRRADALWS